MTSGDLPPPVADDDFPEFAEPPRHRPDLSHEAQEPSPADAVDNGQDEVDDVIARLRRKREEGRR